MSQVRGTAGAGKHEAGEQLEIGLNLRGKKQQDESRTKWGSSKTCEGPSGGGQHEVRRREQREKQQVEFGGQWGKPPEVGRSERSSSRMWEGVNGRRAVVVKELRRGRARCVKEPCLGVP